MKLQAIFPAVLFAAVSSLSFAVHAEDMDKAPADKMKPHSHMEEKTGVAPKAKAKAAEAAAEEKSENAENPKAEKNKSKHFHPRDGK
ncbi:MAG TPA: hypothetical protein VGK09_11915 [Rhodocyclaceae bacterium]|jgi:hypothetical protein